MIKFAATAAALLAIVLVGHVMAEDEDQETSLLLGNQRLFADYCQRERGEIRADLRNKVNKQSSMVYNLFFEKFGVEIANEVMDVAREQVDKHTQNIKEPVSLDSAPSRPLSEAEVEKLMNEGVEQLNEQTGLFGRLRGAACSVFSAMYEAAQSALYTRLAQLRTKMSKENLLQGLADACAQVDEYDHKLNKDLAATKERLAQENDNDEVRQFIESVQVPTLKCQTTRNISALKNFCKILIDGSGHLLKAIGCRANLIFPPPSVAMSQVE